MPDSTVPECADLALLLIAGLEWRRGPGSASRSTGTAPSTAVARLLTAREFAGPPGRRNVTMVV
jgi:hypothetical protein